MGHSLRAGLSLLPAGAIVANVVGGRGVAKLLSEELAQQSRLPHVCAVIRIIGETAGALGIPLLGRHIVAFLGNPLVKALCRAPDRFEFSLIQRRVTLSGTIHECLIGLLRVAEALEYTTGEAGHSTVAAAFGDGLGVRILNVPEVLRACIRVIHIHALIECDRAGIQFNLRLVGAEEEMCGVFSAGVKVWEHLMCQLGQTLVFLMVGDFIREQDAVKLGAGCFAALGLHVVAAVVDAQRNIREGPAHIFRRDPFIRVVRVIVVAVLAQTVGGDKIGCVAVVVLELSDHIVAACRTVQRIHIGDLDRVGVIAVALHAGAVGTVQCECLIG